MASGRGHNGGFNPFRDAHGRFAPASSAASVKGSTQEMNTNIRQAAGRGGGGGGGGGRKPVSAKGADTTTIAPKQLAAVDALPAATLSSISSATQAQLQKHLGGKFPPEESLSYALSEISIQRQTKRLDDAAATGLMTTALTEAGYVAPEHVTKHDILHLMDHVTETRDYELREKRGLYGAAVALKLGDLDVAHNFLDGPDGAGIGGTLTMQEMQKQLGIPVTDGYAEDG